MLVTFLPAFMLSGFLFDLRSMPALVRSPTSCRPATMSPCCRLSFWPGDVWRVIRPERCGARGDGCRPALGSRAVMHKCWFEILMSDSLLRILALTRKELLAVLKDPRAA